MKNFPLVLILLFVFSSCSSDSTSENDATTDLLAHFGLTFNGAGFSNESINIDRRRFSINNNRVSITAGDDDLVNFFGFYLPYPIEPKTYTMVEGSRSSENTVFFSRNQQATYYTTEGSITITEITGGDNACKTYKGTLNINLAYVNDTSQILNISGAFELPTEACDE